MVSYSVNRFTGMNGEEKFLLCYDAKGLEEALINSGISIMNYSELPNIHCLVKKANRAGFSVPRKAFRWFWQTFRK